MKDGKDVWCTKYFGNMQRIFACFRSAKSLIHIAGQQANAFFAPVQERVHHPAGGFVATEDTPYSPQLLVEDIDIPYGDKLTFSMVELPDWLGLSRDGLLKGTPNNADVGLG